MTIHFVVHEEGDSVGTIVVEGVKAGDALTGWIMEQDRTVSVRTLNDIPIGHKIALKALAKPWEEKLREDNRKALDPKLLEALNTPKDKRSAEQQRQAKDAETQIKPEWDEVVDAMPPEISSTFPKSSIRRRKHRLQARPSPPRAPITPRHCWLTAGCLSPAARARAEHCRPRKFSIPQTHPLDFRRPVQE